MKVFVTGITGKSGQYFLNEIVKANDANYSFTFLVRSKKKADEIKIVFPNANIILGGFDDKSLIHKELNDGGYDTLLHIAGIHWSENLVKSAIAGGVKWLILVHTTGIYSKYKAAGENYRKIESRIDEMIQGKGIVKTILRPTMIYGTVSDQNVVVFMKMVYKLRIFPVVDHAKYELQPVFCGDLGKAYYQVLQYPEKTKNKDYNLSGGAPIKLIDMFKVMSKKLGVKNIFINVPFGLAYSSAWILYILSFGNADFRERVQRLVEPRVFSYEAAAKDFGYAPLIFEDGINEEIKEFLNLQK